MLIVDDAHLIEGKRTLDAILGVPDDLPPGSTMMIATRHELGGPAARMRSQGRIHEVGTASLAMDVGETTRLVRAFGLDASEEEVAALTDRTEGWPAALSLAMVSAVDDDRTAGLEAFGGTSRFMADYLRSEFFERNPDQIQFLTRTSIVRTVNGPLCDAVLGTTGSGEDPRGSRTHQRSGPAHGRSWIVPLPRAVPGIPPRRTRRARTRACRAVAR